MPHRNETVLRDLYAAAAEGDVERLRQLIHPDIVWHVPGRNALTGEYKGIDEVLGLFGLLASLTGGTFRSELHDVVAGDEHVVGLHVEHGERAGRSLKASLALRACLTWMSADLHGVVRPWQNWAGSWCPTDCGRSSSR